MPPLQRRSYLEAVRLHMQQAADIAAPTEPAAIRKAAVRTPTRTESATNAAKRLVRTATAKTTVAATAKKTDTGADTTDNRRGFRMRNEQEVNRAVERYSDTIRRLCMIHLKNHADTEDIFQTVFLKYVLSSVSFENDEHEKAWFIRVTINACKDLLKSFFHSRTVSLEEIMESSAALPEDNREVLEAVLSLPQKYKEVVYLHYYEEYTAPEISRILNKNVNTIYTLLTRSRELLREKLGGDGYE